MKFYFTTPSCALGSFALLPFVPSESEKNKRVSVLASSIEDCDCWPSSVSHSIAQYLSTVFFVRDTVQQRRPIGDRLYISILYLRRPPIDHSTCSVYLLAYTFAEPAPATAADHVYHQSVTLLQATSRRRLLLYAHEEPRVWVASWNLGSYGGDLQQLIDKWVIRPDYLGPLVAPTSIQTAYWRRAARERGGICDAPWGRSTAHTGHPATEHERPSVKDDSRPRQI